VVAAAAFEQPAVTVRPGGQVRVGPTLHKLVLAADTSEFRVLVPSHGNYALFAQHGLDEFDGALLRGGKKIDPGHVHEHGGHGHDHEHDETVSSVGIEEKRELDPKKLNAWLSELLQTKGQDIFRMKGILRLKGSASRFVFQGVHMLFEGKPDRAWNPGEEPRSQIVFIGRNLDRDALNSGFRRCLA
jgi:G3E family GTPase